MTRLLTALLISLLVINPVEQRRTKFRSESDTQIAGLIGSVKSIYTEIARLSKISGEWVEQNRMLSSIENFDPEGNLLECDQYRPDGSLARRTLFNHDPYAKLTEVLVYNYYDGNPRLFWRMVYHYNDEGNRIECDDYYASGEHSAKWFYSQDEAGREIEIAFCNPDGSLINKDIISRDAEGRLINSAQYKADGSFEHRWEYSYSEDGRLIRRDFYGHENTLFGWDAYSHELDSAGNWIKETKSTWMWYYKSDEAQPSTVTYRVITYY